MPVSLQSSGWEKYPHLTGLIHARFHEDFDLFGDSVEELISSCTEKMPRSMIDAIQSDIDAFMVDHPGTLESAFDERFGSQFDPALWGYTTASFLEEVTRLLRE